MWWFRAGLALLVGITVLAGCGFQLRGQARQLPAEMATTFIDYSALGNISPADPLARRLRQSLIGNGINVVDSPQAASARLQILSADYRRRTLASGRRGAVREYRLSYQLRFARRLHGWVAGLGLVR